MLGCACGCAPYLGCHVLPPGCIKGDLALVQALCLQVLGQRSEAAGRGPEERVQVHEGPVSKVDHPEHPVHAQVDRHAHEVVRKEVHLRAACRRVDAACVGTFRVHRHTRA